MDHPTRRMYDPTGKDATPGQVTQRLSPITPKPQVRPCIRCQHPMIAVQRNGRASEVSLNYWTYGLLGNPRLETEMICHPWVCPDCGYTELVAVNPGMLVAP